MPNGGHDCCGECVFNPASLVRTGGAASDALTHEAAFCEIRSGLPVADPFYTHCANFHTGSRVPEGPVFAGFHEHGRLPWHGPNPVCLVGERLVVASDGGDREFADPAAYLAWWRGAHPGEDPEYPWTLHERMLPPSMRAEGRDAPSAMARLQALVGRRGGTARRRPPPPADESVPDAWQRRWEWWRALGHEERAEWFLGRALAVLGLDVEERLADTRVEHRPSARIVEAWHAWLLRTTEGVVELAAHVERPTATAFRTFRFLNVIPTSSQRIATSGSGRRTTRCGTAMRRRSSRTRWPGRSGISTREPFLAAPRFPRLQRTTSGRAASIRGAWSSLASQPRSVMPRRPPPSRFRGSGGSPCGGGVRSPSSSSGPSSRPVTRHLTPRRTGSHVMVTKRTFAGFGSGSTPTSRLTDVEVPERRTWRFSESWENSHLLTRGAARILGPEGRHGRLVVAPRAGPAGLAKVQRGRPHLRIDNSGLLWLYLAMRQVKIAELKDRLSEHLRAVENGAEVVVMDRNRAIARIVPLPPPGRHVRLLQPSRGFPEIRDRRRAPAGWPVPSTELLFEERRDR